MIRLSVLVKNVLSAFSFMETWICTFDISAITFLIPFFRLIMLANNLFLKCKIFPELEEASYTPLNNSVDLR